MISIQSQKQYQMTCYFFQVMHSVITTSLHLCLVSSFHIFCHHLMHRLQPKLKENKTLTSKFRIFIDDPHTLQQAKTKTCNVRLAQPYNGLIAKMYYKVYLCDVMLNIVIVHSDGQEIIPKNNIGRCSGCRRPRKATETISQS